MKVRNRSSEPAVNKHIAMQELTSNICAAAFAQTDITH